MDLTNGVWRKASRSNDSGDACVEIAPTPSAVVWRKASHSNESGDACIEMAPTPEAVAIRDSKDPDGPRIVISSSDFRNLANVLKNL
ncbi:DUF397 domain-containing protein [Actinomadura chibensis]|uniref:DUF397 domain-containing protein n=1 Tax=Actinomadura chibensis TaxID=392828 RepID=A0A5D0NUK0_9ACTN|nr:DUF397 domain-containing protein [Actinomadura chibensis]TYB48065.1 DUF397 domain-containing protein [Actinomadura chibensis]